jgi:trehalose-6-phosphate synthase
MAITNKKFVMISNRGPNFVSGNVLHRGMGGTKEIYTNLINCFCQGWICLAPEELQSNDIKSEYGKKLKVVFVKKKRYCNYYYKYVSEYLYPMLLGYFNKAIKTHSKKDIRSISQELVNTVKKNYGESNVIICDYHLFQIPKLIKWKCHKVFFWFIPILTEKYYFPEMKEIIWSLSKCDEIYFFNEVWGTNFKKAFRHYFPNRVLETKVRAIMMGPDEKYLLTSKITKNDYFALLNKKLKNKNWENKKIILSVSRMDFVKNIPLLIQGFEQYLEQNTLNKKLELIIIAPHHRKDSTLYCSEAEKIFNLVKKSKYKKRIHLTHDYFEANELKILFKYTDIFICPSTFDAVPLTPLEYILSNDGFGRVILSNSIGAYTLLFPNCYDFKHGNKKSLAKAINNCIIDNKKNRVSRMKAMKSVVSEKTIQKAMKKINYFLKNYE